MMKNTYLYSALLLLLTVSCGHRSYPQLLLTADSLAEVCPDSAIALLKTYAPQVKGQSTAVRNYYDLLCIKASDKAYIRNTTDSVILRLVDYYEHGGDKHLLPVAYYYAGRVYRDLNDAPQALEFFQKAVSLMVEPFYLKQKELTYNQMGHLFRRQRLDSDARKMYNKSFLCARQMNDTLMMIFNLRDIACIYDYKTEPDSSLPRFKQALHLSYSIHNEDMIASLETQLASFYIDREEYIKALEYMQHPLKHNNPKEHRALYIMMAHIYDGLGKTDSSFIYYRKLTQLDDIMAKQEGHRGLSEYYTVNQNLPDSCFCHLKQYRIAVDSLVKIRSVESVSQMNALYNYQLREKANATLKIVNQRNQLYIYGLICMVILSIMTIIIISQHVRKKKEQYKNNIKELKRLREEQFTHSQEYISQKEAEIESLNEMISKYELNHIQQANELRTKLASAIRQRDLAIIERDEQEYITQAIRESDIFKLFCQLADNQKHPTIMNWNDLDTTITSYYPQFKERLYGHINLSDFEYHICLLVKIQMSPTQMVLLTNHSKSAISSVRARLYTKVFGVKGSSQKWDEFISSL